MKDRLMSLPLGIQFVYRRVRGRQHVPAAASILASSGGPVDGVSVRHWHRPYRAYYRRSVATGP